MATLLKTKSITEALSLLSVNVPLPTTFVDDEYWHERALLSSHQLNEEHVRSLINSDATAVLVNYEIRYKSQNCNWLWRKSSQLLLTKVDFTLWSKLVEGEGARNIEYIETPVYQAFSADYLPYPTYNLNGYSGKSFLSYSAQIKALGMELSDFEITSKSSAFGSVLINKGGDLIIMPWSGIFVREFNNSGL